MRRYLSEAQSRDLRNRMVVGMLLTTLAAAVYLIGPGLELVLEHARANKEEDWAPERFYRVAQVMECTFRQEQAQQVYEEFYLYYCGVESIDDDMAEELFGEIQPRNPDWWYYLPWVEHRYDPDVAPRPRPVSARRHPLLGRVLVAVGKYHEGRRYYTHSEHVFRCLRDRWEEGTFEHREGVMAWRRSMQRSF